MEIFVFAVISNGYKLLFTTASLYIFDVCEGVGYTSSCNVTKIGTDGFLRIVSSLLNNYFKSFLEWLLLVNQVFDCLAK